MTWNLFDTLGSGGNVTTGRVINDFQGDVVYISTLSTDIWQYVVGGSDTKIGDASDLLIQQYDGPYPVLLNGTALYLVGSGGATIVRKCISYDGTALNWTLQAALNTLADTSGNSDMFAAPIPNKTALIAALGVVSADGGLQEVARSLDGTTWTKTAVLGVRSAANPIPVAGDDGYIAIRNGSSQYRFAAYNGGAWTLNSSVYALATYNVAMCWWIDQELAGGGFSGLWLRRSADNVLLRSVNGGSSFAVTQTDTAVDFTGTQIDIFSLRGLEFARSAVGGLNRLWYFNNVTLQWVLVDTTVLPQTAIDGMFVRGTTLYLIQGDDIYTTDSGFSFVDDDEFDPASMPKPADIDADGSYIYTAALNSAGFPVLIKFSTALSADGTIVFDPGSGTDIGVECSETNGDVVWVAGDFNGNNTVEKTENAGSSFAVKDPGTFQPVTAFKVGPLTDEIVLVATESSGSIGLVSIEETRNDGTAWSEKNAGLSAPARIRALDRLDINDAEIVLGNSNAATHRADYSPNTGDDLDDITTGTPAFNATAVIVP